MMSQCQPTAVDSGGVYDLLAADANNIYYIRDHSSVDLIKVPITGGAPSVVATGVADSWSDPPIDLATDGASVFILTGLSIQKVSIANGTLTDLTPQVPAKSPNFLHMAVDDTKVWLTWDGFPVLQSILKGGGPLVAEVSGEDQCFKAPGGQGVIAVDANNVYWNCSSLFGKVKSMPANPFFLPGYANALAVDSTNIFLTASGVARLASASGPPFTYMNLVVIALGGEGHALAIDPENVYWIEAAASTASLMEAPMSGADGGAPTQLAATTLTSAIVAIGKYVYYTDAGQLWKVPK
jgi:hypothetical protein